MQITETSAEDLKREYKIVIGADDIEEKVTAKLNDLGKTITLPGFRPGKVPVSLLRKRFGQSVMGEVLEEAVSTSSQQAIQENSLTPALQPKIEVTQFEEGSNLEYTMAVEIMPDIEMPDFAAIELERLVLSAGAEEVDEALERMAEQQKTFETIEGDKAAGEVDAVLIDFTGTIDGEAFEGGTAEGHLLELGGGRFIPGFEEQLVGTKAGDKKDVSVTFPEDYPSADLASKAAVFAVEVKEVRVAKPAPIDNELATRMGMEDLSALKEAVKGQIAQEYADISRDRLKRSLLDTLSDGYEFGVPEGMVDQELESILEQFRSLGERNELEEEDKDKSEDELREEYRPIAERRIRLGLLLGRVGETNNIIVNDDEVSRALTDNARRFPGRERQVIEFYQSNPQAMAQLKAPLFEDKVVDFILELAKVSERSVTRDELMQDPEQATAGTDADAEKKKPNPRRRPKPKRRQKRRPSQRQGTLSPSAKARRRRTRTAMATRAATSEVPVVGS